MKSIIKEKASRFSKPSRLNTDLFESLAIGSNQSSAGRGATLICFEGEIGTTINEWGAAGCRQRHYTADKLLLFRQAT